MGIQKGILENPNDLAINIAINLPLCMAFMFAARGAFRKILWASGMVCMVYAVVATYSRSGMIATVITSVICLWEFGVKFFDSFANGNVLIRVEAHQRFSPFGWRSPGADFSRKPARWARLRSAGGDF